MPSLKDLRVRIRSVRSTQKITSAMKMVAASRLRPYLIEEAHEVDDARWLPFAEARALLTYERDRDLLDGI